MGMKPPIDNAPLAIRNGVNQPKSRDMRAGIKNMARPERATTEGPVKNSVQKKRFGKG